jgi:hypothetical protein
MDPQVHYLVNNSLTLLSILSQTNAEHTTPCHLFNIRSYICLRQVISSAPLYISTTP